MPHDKDYPADMAKRDPLTPEVIKIPKSVLTFFSAVAKRRMRFRSFVIREVLIDAADKMRIELAKEEQNEKKLRAKAVKR